MRVAPAARALKWLDIHVPKEGWWEGEDTDPAFCTGEGAPCSSSQLHVSVILGHHHLMISFLFPRVAYGVGEVLKEAGNSLDHLVPSKHPLERVCG